MFFRFAYRSYRLAFRTPVRTAHNVWTERTGILVRFETESGQRGYGEASPIPWFGTETTEGAEEICRGFGDGLSGEQLDAVPVGFPCLRGALEAAMQDCARQSAQQTETSDGGVDQTAYFPVAALLPAGKAVLSKINAAVESGFRTFKWKVGVDDVAEEIGLLDDLLARMPRGAKLRLDANGAWDRRRAERWLERCADRPIEFVEQPIAHDFRGAEDLLLGLAADYPTPIALDESAALAGEIERWLGLGWKGVFVVKSQLLNGVSDILSRLANAKANVVFSSALETAVGGRRALSLAFGYPGERRALGFGVWPLFKDYRFDGPTAAPFIRRSDVDSLDPETVWNALT